MSNSGIESISFETRVTIKEAYLIMFEYLLKDYERGHEEGGEMGGMLSQLSLWDTEVGKQPMDGAVFPDFLEAAANVLRAEKTADGYRLANVRLFPKS